jgi:hypothetical protein
MKLSTFHNFNKLQSKQDETEIWELKLQSCQQMTISVHITFLVRSTNSIISKGTKCWFSFTTRGLWNSKISET